MIFATDLIRGLVALQDAPREALQEPESGYALAGFSFTASELYEEVRRHFPAFKTTPAPNENMEKFARLWPDELAPEEAERDLGFRARVGLKYTVKRVLAAHDARMRLGHAVLKCPL
jgi:nucleoside-diphosphate-sugar epimerase